MKFACPQSELNTHLSLVSRAVSSRPNKPILANILVTADLDTQLVSLVGFDESLGIQTCFSAAVETGGRLTLPAKFLGDIVSRLPAETLTLDEVDEDEVVLSYSSGKYTVRGISAEEYPNLPEVEAAGQTAKLAVEVLLEGLKGSLFATSGDETKQVLTGVHLLAEPEILEFAATDGHRLAVVQTQDEQGRADADAPPLEVTIPAKALRELERVLLQSQTAEPVALQFDQTQVVFDLGLQKITTRLLDGQYPNYRQLIPRQFARQVTLDRKQFISSLERIAVLAQQKNNIVKFTLDSANQVLALSVEAQEVGSGREQVPAQITGEDLEIAFNVSYLLEGLKTLPSGEVQLQCNGATSPAVITPLGGLKLTYLVMPVQVRN
jgi:DNA polymerase-3 subunit beta